ncbi:MAG TPA: NAD-dependent epimerase/dehydratase family protein, partial [Planctomycetota bacterium]|nr:NAD-dependent epimerase/dehydratase family protein [Planctomycetota bacterium]
MSLTLVTGGTGFLGRHLVAALRRRGEAVRVLARPASDVSGLPEVEVLRGDLTSRDDLARALEGVTRVFHAAAETRDGQPAAHYRAVNSAAVETLLALAHERGVERFVHTSSYFAIGRTGEPRSAPDQVADEYWTHDPGDMHDAHEESKYDAEHAVNQRVSLSEPVLALVPTLIYGPEARPVASLEQLAHGNRIVRMLAEHAAGRYPGVPGTGRQLWNLVHVEDVVAGHLAAMDGDPGSPRWPPPQWGHWHYILGGENVSVDELFARFERLTGVRPPKTVGPGGLLGRLLGGGSGRTRERYAMDSHSW